VLISQRYAIEGVVTGASDEIVAHDTYAKVPVRLWVVSREQCGISPEAIFRFKKTAQSLLDISHPNLERILEVGEDHGLLYVAKEAREGESLTAKATGQAPPDLVAEWMLAAAKGLAAAHAKGILHAGVHPDTLWLGPEGIKVVRFGEGLLRNLAAIKPGPEAVRVFGCLAPEQAGILRKPVDHRSDLYSLGIVFYFLLTGCMPYEGHDANTLIYQHIATAPLPPSEIRRQIPRILDRICLKLMAKEPEDRYHTADGLQADLSEYLALHHNGQESISFEIGLKDRKRKLNFATSLVGREKEVAFLRGLLGAAQDGKGQVCFIAGEPGVGKSSLVDELRTLAYQAGELFLGGKGRQHQMPAPYQIVAEVIEALVSKLKRLGEKDRTTLMARLHASVGGLGGELLKITPAAAELLGVLPELAPIEQDQEKTRFMMTALNFLGVLGEERRPAILFFDDLQWADGGSLELLERLCEKVSNKPLLVLLSYRTAEGGDSVRIEALQKRLQANSLSLQPLEPAALRRLVAQVFSESEEAVEGLAGVVQDRARGNPFSAMQLLRFLVEQGLVRMDENGVHYNQKEIAQCSLPENAVEIVLRRASLLPDVEANLLSYAAMLGNEIDARVLAQLAQLHIEEVRQAVENAISQQVLEQDLTGNEHVHFVHDRVREAFYKRISDEQRGPLHLKIATLIETLSSGDLDRPVFELAYHYRQAHAASDKALEYSIRAGIKARQALAYELAAHSFETAHRILEQRGQTQDERYLDVLEPLGEMHRLAGHPEMALEILCHGEALAERIAPHRLVAILAVKADALFDQGNIQDSAAVIMQVLRRFEIHIPNSPIAFGLALVKEVFEQFLHILLPRIFINRKLCEDPRQLTALRLLKRLSYVVYFSGRLAQTMHAYLKALNYAERKGVCETTAHLQISGAIVWVTVPLPWLARRALALGGIMARKLKSRALEASVDTYYEALAQVENKPEMGLRHAESAIASLQGLGEYYTMGIAYVVASYLYFQQGRITKGIEISRALQRLGEDAQMRQVIAWGMFNKRWLQSFIGELDPQAFAEIEQSNRISVECHSEQDIPMGIVVEAFCHVRQGEYPVAMNLIQEALNILKEPNSGFWTLWSLVMASQVYLDCLRHAALSPDQRRAYLSQAAALCRRSLQWGRKFKYILGWAFQVNGTYCWLTGRRRQAMTYWEKGLKYLRKQSEDIYRIAWIKMESAELRLEAQPRDARAFEDLLEARDLFVQCQDVKDGRHVDELIKKYQPNLSDLESRSVLTYKRHLESLLSVTQTIGSVFDSQEVLDKIVDYARQVTGAERSFLLLYNDQDQLELRRSMDPERCMALPKLEESGISQSLVGEVEQTKTARSAEANEDTKAGKELKFQGVKQALCVPLCKPDKYLGCLYLDNRLASGVFGEAELDLMRSFGVQAAVSIQNARLVRDLVEQDRIKQELKLGRSIQMGLLPKAAPLFEGLTLAGFMEPAKEIGGDYYDFIERTLADGRRKLGITIGDVSGKGLGAGLAMAMVKTTILALAQEGLGLRDLMAKTNHFLHCNTDGSLFVSLVYLEWTPEERIMRFCSAGHEHILVYRAQTGSVEAIRSGGLVMGILPDIKEQLNESSFTLGLSDKIVLYTDGVTEAFNAQGEEFGFERLVETVQRVGAKPAESLLACLHNEVSLFRGDCEQSDDITLVVLESAPVANPQRA